MDKQQAYGAYLTNQDVRDFVDKAAKTRHRTKEEILGLKMTEEVIKYYQEK